MTESIPTTESIKALVAWASVQDLPDDERTAPKMAEARRRFDAWLAEVERAAAEKAIKALEVELVGSMDDGTFIAPWVEIPAGEIRETIWTVFDSYRAEAYRREETE